MPPTAGRRWSHAGPLGGKLGRRSPDGGRLSALKRIRVRPHSARAISLFPAISEGRFSYEQPGLPPNWTEDHHGPVCLACRRGLAAEAAVSGAPMDLPTQERARLRSFAIVEFEVRRDPNRSNAQIASAVHTSVVAVQKVRERPR
jgi:hypothetical protein